MSTEPPPQMKAPPPNFWGDMPEAEYYTSQGVTNTQSYFATPNGKIFNQSFLPLDRPVKGTVFMTHGYGSDTGWLFQKICINYATWGYAVFAADLLGHGRSDGIRCYLGNLEQIAATSLSFFVSVRHSEEYKDLPAFLFGESMGGAATMLMYFQSEPSTKNLLVRGCASFFCFGRAAAGLESPSPFKVGPAQQQDILPAPPVTDKGKAHIHTTDLVEDDSNTGKLAFKSNLKKPTNTIPVSGGVVSECEVLCENGRDIPGHMERRKVQWTAASGGEIAQIREFELSDVGGSDDEFDNGDERHCSCRIM
ncbi:hypothetical protein CsSME_00041803 [Camellia sinensis var. sinensis]